MAAGFDLATEGERVTESEREIRPKDRNLLERLELALMDRDKPTVFDITEQLRVGDGAGAGGADGAEATRIVSPLIDVWDAPVPEPILWRDPGQGHDFTDPLIGAGEVGILSGPGGAGKSTVCLALARAAHKPDCPMGHGDACGLRIKAGPVAILSYEDAPVRLAHRAAWFGPRDRWEHVHVAKANPPALWTTADLEEGYSRESGPSDWWNKWWGAVAALEPVLAIIDPASVAFSGASPSDGAAVRAFLAAVTLEAVRIGCGVLIVAHDTKGARNEARAGLSPGPGAVSGSAQWTDGARAVLHLSSQSGGGRAIECVKANYSRAGWGANLRGSKGMGDAFTGWELDARIPDMDAERERTKNGGLSKKKDQENPDVHCV